MGVQLSQEAAAADGALVTLVQASKLALGDSSAVEWQWHFRDSETSYEAAGRPTLHSRLLDAEYWNHTDGVP